MKAATFQTRREFLRTSLLGGAMSWSVPAFVHLTMQMLCDESDGAVVQRSTGKDGRILVVLQLAGGNDGLNTVVPVENDFYYRARPTLAISRGDGLALRDGMALHPALEGLKAMYDAGHLAIVQGVGYPNPNRSHFRSMEIWQTASDADRVESLGWIGRYFDCCCSGTDATVGISLSQEAPQAFAARTPRGLTFENIGQYRYQGDEEFLRRVSGGDVILAEDINTGGSIGGLTGRRREPVHSALDFLERTSLDAQLSSERIRRIAGTERSSARYPAGQLGRDLSLVARLIAGGMTTRVYYVSQGGYDTHANQKGTQERLLRELGDALKAFVDDVKEQGNLERVMVMSFSEFGRRVAQNASGGTDHGTASPMFVAGGGVRAGLHGQLPSLDPKDLDEGDLRHKIDFRSVYATVVEKHLEAPGHRVLQGQFPLLHIV